MISLECDSCGTNYKVKDHHAGKEFQCRLCQSFVQVPDASRHFETEAPVRRQEEARKRLSDPEQYDEYDGHDADYGSYDEAESYDDNQGPHEDDYESSRSWPSGSSGSHDHLSSSKSQRLSGTSNAGFSLDIFCDWRVVIGLPAVSSVLVVLLIFIPVIGPFLSVLACVLFFVASVSLMAIGGILSIVDAFREGITAGLLYLFFPFYSVYFTVTRWSQTRGAFMMQVTGVLCFVASLVAALVATLIATALGMQVPAMR